MQKKSRLSSGTLDKVLVGILTLLVVVTSGWVTEGAGGACVWEGWAPCQAGSNDRLLRLGISLLGFGVFAVWLYRKAAQFLPARVLEQTNVTGKKVLIAALSPLDPKPNMNAKPPQVTKAGTTIELTGDLDADITALGRLPGYWNGQQFLRSLQPHLREKKLTHVRLIGSPNQSGRDGSYASLKEATKLIELYARANGCSVEVTTHPEAVHFEYIDALREVFDTCIKSYVEGQDIPQSEVILDATGGNKTASIAAALTTLRWRHVLFQYVQTNVDNPRVLAFNAVIELPQREGGA